MRGPDGKVAAAGHTPRSPAAHFATACLLTAGLLLGASAASAEEPQEEPTEKESAAETPFAASTTIHGYLSQAYARTDGNEIAGITESGTADYRTAAIQLRTEISPQDTFAIQLSHERLGTTGLQEFQDDVALDWIFYAHRFGDSSEVKVGKVQIPFGIYNEVRDVGTLFPFYRPSSNFYGEGSYTSETVDGIVLSHRFQLGSSWQLDGDLYYGNWEFVARSNGFFNNKVKNSRGVELWLQTPVRGLRVGAGGIRYDVLPGDNPGQTVPWKTYHLSMEWALGRVTAQAEYKKIDFGGGDYDAGYLHLGVDVTDKISVHGQIDTANLNIDFFREGDFDDEKVLGVNCAFRSDLVVKLEHHWNEGYTAEVPAQNFFAPKPKTNYWIASLSTSF